MSKFRVWLELSRVANLPTVWSNVFIGWLIAVAFGGTVCVHKLGWVLLSTSLLYVAGMFLNDAADADWDRERFPGRPIVSGKVRRLRVWQMGMLFLSLGLLICFTWSTLGLVLLILAYTRWHKTRPSLAPWLMGACRTVLPAIGYLSVCLLGDEPGVRLLLAYQLALFLYTASISLLARHETTGGRPSFYVTLFACLSPFTILLGVPTATLQASALGCAALVAVSIPLTHYLIPTIGQRVAERIAGLILLDYVVWRQLAPSFAQTDALSFGGIAVLVLYGTALVLRRLIPST